MRDDVERDGLANSSDSQSFSSPMLCLDVFKGKVALIRAHGLDENVMS
jgi:hypothetical protein